MKKEIDFWKENSKMWRKKYNIELNQNLTLTFFYIILVISFMILCPKNIYSWVVLYFQAIGMGLILIYIFYNQFK